MVTLAEGQLVLEHCAIAPEGLRDALVQARIPIFPHGRGGYLVRSPFLIDFAGEAYLPFCVTQKITQNDR